MIEPVVKKYNLHDDTEAEDLEYLDTLTGAERFAIVDMLRRQFYGEIGTFQVVAKIRDLGQSPDEAISIDGYHKQQQNK